MPITLDGTNGITSPDLDVDGSTAPANGVYRPAVNTLGFSTNSTERMRIDTSGNVGFGGAPSGSALLDILGNDPKLLFRDTAGSPASNLSIRSADGNLIFRDESNVRDVFRINGSSGDSLEYVASSGSFGYGTGAGGTVTQLTSRTTAVTINKPTGSITMFSAAGSTSPSSFTVNNSLVTVNDTVVLSLRGGNTNVYNYQINGLGAGTFAITFWTTGGTSVDAPVINFAIIKGVTS